MLPQGKFPLDVVVVGGSLTGLMHGIMLRALGHNVHIVEQAPEQRDSHMAGVCLADEALEFLRRFDRVVQPWTLESECLQVLNSQAAVTTFVTAHRGVTSWDSLYWRLRANFDGRASDYYPSPPPKDFKGAGNGVYRTECRVVDVLVPDDREKLMSVVVQGVGSEKSEVILADLVLAADGPNSSLRQRFLPNSQRQYSGYVAWRGTVREVDVSEETRRVFSKNVTLFLMPYHHALVYNIPGRNGSIDPGERLLNFLWYTNEDEESLKDIMTDSSGHRHRNIVPAGQVRPDVWQRLCDRGDRVLAKPYSEMLRTIPKPFIQRITDFHSPQASFAGGRILLVGDGLALLRPHTAFSNTHAAYDCLTTERYVKGEISLRTWETSVLHFARLHWSRSVWFGDYYQYGRVTSYIAAARFWLVAAKDLFFSWLYGTKNHIRF